MRQREIIHIADDGGWYLVHEGRRIGPYSTEDEAASVARRWAELASQQGFDIEVVFDGGGDMSVTGQDPTDSQSA